ncbi:Integrase [Abeliophyllum distichum]|uniref:Integrase n=1 Tax=Abeliophyllum distichum TaxID=126358 RepID=A0ABD1Q4K0_9LAMI
MRMMGSDDSHKLWKAIKETYGIQNKSRITFLTIELQTSRKGDLNIDQYLSKVKILADNIEVARKPILLADLVNQVLAGLDEDYTPIVVTIEVEEEGAGIEEIEPTTMKGLSAKYVENQGIRLMCATIDTMSDPAWLANTEASNDVTADIKYLNSEGQYSGKKKIMVGNGDKLNISCIGNSKIPTLTDKPLVLNKLLHVPEIKTNLVSVSQLTADNCVFMEFHPDYCCVKDQSTRKPMLEGNLREGLYQLDLPKVNNQLSVQSQESGCLQ